MKVAAIIPARGGSKRLPGKNIYPLFGKPLISYAIKACRDSKYITDVFVSSDDQKILQVAAVYGAIPLLRESILADDLTPKITAIRGIVKQTDYLSKGPYDIIAIVQANSPEITGADLDRGMELLIKHDLWEVMSANKDGVQNAAFRIIKSEHLNNDFLSAHCGFVVAECMDVHTLEDIIRLETKSKNL